MGVFVCIVLITFSTITYFLYSNYREHTFYELLRSRVEAHQELFESTSSDDGLNSRHHLILADERYAIYELNGSTVYASEGAPTKISPKILTFLVNSGNAVYKDRRGNQQEIYTAVKNNSDGHQYIIYASSLDKIGYDRQEFLFRIILIGSVIVGLLTFWLVTCIARKDLFPLEDAARQMQSISFDNLGSRVIGIDKDNEVGDMARAFNGVMSRLQLSVEQQKSFVSYVSHELRNPLAILQGQAEVALLRERQPQEYIQVLHDIKDEVRDTILLVNDLLLMASTNANNNVEFTPDSIDDILWKARKAIVDKRPDYEIIVIIPTDTESTEDFMLQRANADLLKILFKNLLDNACKYSDDNRAIATLDVYPESVKITVLDNGHGISEEDLKHLFEPFYRASHTRNIHGHGLGLPLVKQIVDLHHGEITIKSTIDEGTQIIVLLPKTFTPSLTLLS